MLYLRPTRNVTRHQHLLNSTLTGMTKYFIYINITKQYSCMCVIVVFELVYPIVLCVVCHLECHLVALLMVGISKCYSFRIISTGEHLFPQAILGNG